MITVLSHNGSCNDNYAKLLLHGNGAQGSSIVGDSSRSQNSVFTIGGVVADTSQYKFGRSSILFDGSTGYLSIPNNSNFNFSYFDFAIDFWINFSNLDNPIIPLLTNMDASVANGWTLSLNNNGLEFANWSNAQTVDVFSLIPPYIFTLSTKVWYHFAITRQNPNPIIGTSFYRFFFNGLDIGKTTTASSTLSNSVSSLLIGTNSTQTAFFNGFINELRISKGIVRWIKPFVPYTHPY